MVRRSVRVGVPAAPPARPALAAIPPRGSGVAQCARPAARRAATVTTGAGPGGPDTRKTPAAVASQSPPAPVAASAIGTGGSPAGVAKVWPPSYDTASP